jgi:hypothetical protein
MAMKPKVLLTRALFPEAEALFKTDFDLEIGNKERMLSREELLEKVKGKDAVITMMPDTIDRALLDAAPGLLREHRGEPRHHHLPASSPHEAEATAPGPVEKAMLQYL